MNTDAAIFLAGSATDLAQILNITPSAVSQWGEAVPKPRYWQLRVLRPNWFDPATGEASATALAAAAADSAPVAAPAAGRCGVGGVP